VWPAFAVGTLKTGGRAASSNRPVLVTTNAASFPSRRSKGVPKAFQAHRVLLCRYPAVASMPVELSSDQRNVTSGKLDPDVLWPVVADHHNRSSTAASTLPAAEKRGRTELECKAIFPHFWGVLNLDFVRTPVTLKQHFRPDAERLENAHAFRYLANLAKPHRGPRLLARADCQSTPPYRAIAGSVGNLVFRKHSRRIRAGRQAMGAERIS
jgi:hypothetical protein